MAAGEGPLIRRIDESRVVSDLAVVGGIVRGTLTETRRVAIGKKSDKLIQTRDGKGTFRPPVKLDYFLVTTTERGETDDFIVDWQFHKEVLKNEKPRELPIFLLFDRIALSAQTYLGLYAGRRAWCKGNGKIAQRAQKESPEFKAVDCPCPYLSVERKCKPHLRFQFKLPGMGKGEAAVFRSTGWHTISAITGSLVIIKEHVAMLLDVPFDAAPLSGLPLTMKYLKKTVSDKEGKLRTIPIVTVICQLSDEEIRVIVEKRQKFLKDTADFIRGLAQRPAEQFLIEQRKEEESKKVLLQPDPPAEAKAVQEEFHPELVDVPAPPEPPKSPAKRAAEADEMAKYERKALRVLPEGFEDAVKQAEEETPPEDVIAENGPPPTENAKPTRTERRPKPDDSDDFL